MNRKKTFLYGSRAVALSLLVAILVIALNALTSFLVTQYPHAKLDITPQRYYSVSKDAKSYLKGVDTPVTLTTLTCMAPEDVKKPMDMIGGTMERMAALNDNITYEVFDLDQDEAATNAFIEKYAASSPDGMTVFSIVVEKADGTFRVVNPTLLESGYMLFPAFDDLEQQVINGINKVLKGDSAEEITIPKKPTYNQSLRLGIDPDTKQVNMELMEKQVQTLEILFVVVFPLVMFLAGILVFVLKRKK